MINILHVLDMAGVPSIISHYQNKMKFTNSKLIYHKKNNVDWNIARFYDGMEFQKFHQLIIHGLKIGKNYDIIHIHGAETLIPIFKIIGKKIILHYHGSDIRHPGRSEDRKRIFCRSLADFIIYNAKSMEEKIITYKKTPTEFLPNLIDSEHFSNKKFKNRKKGLIITSSNHDKINTIKTVKEIDDVDVIDLDRQQIPYSFMPNILSQYEMYYDIRIMPWGQTLEELSTTALQALACNTKVYINGKILTKIPEENKPQNYINKLDSIYKRIV